MKKSGAELKELVLEEPTVRVTTPSPIQRKELPDIKKHAMSPQPKTGKHFLPSHAQGVLFKSREMVKPVVGPSSFIDERRKSFNNSRNKVASKGGMSNTVIENTFHP